MTLSGPLVQVLLDDALPLTFALCQNYLTPFNPLTTILCDLPRETHVRIAVFSLVGQEVATWEV